MVKFAHLADCHIGAWRDPRMRTLGDKALEKATDVMIKERVDFVVLAGDLFNTALPGIDHIKTVVKQFQRLKQLNIPIYFIAGSHDYSPTGKTMLDVLEEAGLCENVFKGKVEDGKLALTFTKDEKTGVMLTGILGKAGQLDKELYETMVTGHLERETGKKIFLFHTTLTELKPKGMEQVDSQPISFLPKGFDYYAGGHVHIVDNVSMPGYSDIVYPGPLFPASFSELEELGNGGFYIVNIEDQTKERVEIVTKRPVVMEIDCSGLTVEEIETKLARLNDVQNKIVLIRLNGTLKEGKPTDINFRNLFDEWEKLGAYFCMKNTNALKSKDSIEVDVKMSSASEAEEEIVKEYSKDATKEDLALMKNLLSTLAKPQSEGEKKKEYEERILDEALQLIQG